MLQEGTALEKSFLPRAKLLVSSAITKPVDKPNKVTLRSFRKTLQSIFLGNCDLKRMVCPTIVVIATEIFSSSFWLGLAGSISGPRGQGIAA